MNKWQKEVQQSLLDSEEAAIKELEKQYKRALKDINDKIKLFDYDIRQLEDAINADGLDDAAREVLKSQQRAKVYQKQYQEALKGQISGVVDNLHAQQYATIDKYLKECYTDGFVGTMYDISKQGIPLIMPIDQAAVVKAVLTDSKVSKGLYTALGVNYSKLKKTIAAEVSRGIASGLSYADIARNINNASKSGLSNAKRIARTEGHRIAQTSADDARRGAISRGADVVKQWDAALDSRTRDSHARVDGEIREEDEKFSNGLMFPGDPSGEAAEVINCRCVALTRARWALDESELETLKERAEYFGLDKAENFKDYEEKYLKAASQIEDGAITLSDATTIKDLENAIAQITGKSIDLAGTDIDLMRKNMEQLVRLGEEYGYRFDAINTTGARKYLGEVTRTGRYGDAVTLNYPKKYYKNREALLQELRKTAQDGSMPRIGGRNIEIYTTTHEFAHTLSDARISRLYGGDDAFWDEIEDVYADYKKYGGGVLGKYAASNQNEFMAEAFADAKLSTNPSKWSTETLAIIDKYFKKPLENSANDVKITVKSTVVKDAVKSGAVSTTINADKQSRHIKGSKGYIEGRSYINGTLEDAQKLVDELSSTGEPVMSKGKWQNKERVVSSKVIGVHIDPETKTETETKNGLIIYSKTGSHIVPRK